VLNVGGNHDLYIKGDRTEAIGGTEVRVVNNDQFLNVMGMSVEFFNGPTTRFQTSSRVDDIRSGYYLKVQDDRVEDIGGTSALDAQRDVYIKAGMAITIEADTTITLKTPTSFIEIGPAGVVIEGPLVRINCGGAAMPAIKPPGRDADKAKQEQPKSPFAQLQDFIKGLG